MTVDKDNEGTFVRAEPQLNEMGFSTVRFDFRAHGKSSGNSITDSTISGELADLEAVVDFLRKQGISWTGLAGASLGGGIAALYAEKHPETTDALFLANPAINFEEGYLKSAAVRWAMKELANIYRRTKHQGFEEFIEVTSRKFKEGKKLFNEMKLYSPCKSLQKYTGKLLIVQGDRDSLVDHQDVITCYEGLFNPHKRLEIIKGSEHGFHEEPYETQVVEVLVNFFKEAI